jgi:TolB-like protein
MKGYAMDWTVKKLIGLLKIVRYQYLCQIMLISWSFSLVACAGWYYDPSGMNAPSRSPWQQRGYHEGRFRTSFLADQIDSYYRGTHPGPIGVTTFVDVDNLYTSSTFGRLYAEQLMSELAMRGFDVVELRHGDALQFLSNTGEFALSREISMVRRQRDLAGVIVGTYVASPARVYVNARLINPSNSMVLSAGTAEMEKTMEIAKLLRSGPFSGTLERIPVRHIGGSAYPMMIAPQHRPGLLEDGWDPMGVSPAPQFQKRTEVAPVVRK